MEVDKVIVIVKIIHRDIVVLRVISIFNVVVVVEISLNDVIKVVMNSWLLSGGAVLGRRFDFGYGVYFIKHFFAGPATSRPVETSKIIDNLWTFLDVAGTNS